MFSMNLLNSKLCQLVKGLNLPPDHLLCKRPACYHNANKTHGRDRIIKLSPIHALVIYQFPWIHWNPVLFRENPLYYRKIWLNLENLRNHWSMNKSMICYTRGSIIEYTFSAKTYPEIGDSSFRCAIKQQLTWKVRARCIVLLWTSLYCDFRDMYI